MRSFRISISCCCVYFLPLWQVFSQPVSSSSPTAISKPSGFTSSQRCIPRAPSTSAKKLPSIGKKAVRVPDARPLLPKTSVTKTVLKHQNVLMHLGNDVPLISRTNHLLKPKPMMVSKIASGYVNLSDFAKQNGMKYACKGKQVQLSNTSHQFSFTVGTKEATLDGVKSFLSFPVDLQQAACHGLKKVAQRLQLIAPVYRIRAMDAQAILKPILSPKTFVSKKPKIIVIDPGHGGKADGTIQNGLKEKVLTLRTAQLLATKLRNRGYIVHLTRATDMNLSLTQRSDFANAKKADLFVSIHYNAAPSQQACGIETYTYPMAGSPSTDRLHVLPKDHERANVNQMDAQNFRLAWSVQKQIVGIVKPVDRGVKRMRLGVLKDLQNKPGILIECGFLSNSTEAKRCNRADYQEKLACAIANGIGAY